jgi:hypothetical protein
MERQGMSWLWILCFFILVGCDVSKSGDQNKLSSEPVIINIGLGQSVDVLLNGSPVQFTEDCLAAVGMCWYEVRRNGKGQSLINVSVNQPEGAVLIERVVGLSVVIKGARTKPVEDLTVALRGLPDNSSHEENKKLVYSLITNLKASGWKQYYYPSDPRIPGSELHKFDWQRSVFGDKPLTHPRFDVDYEMSLPDWLAPGDFYDWYMYSGDYVSHIRVWRSDSPTHPAKTGIYLISVEFMSLDNFWRRDFKEAVRPKWKELFPAHLQQLRNKRLVTEARAKAAGVSIDENYLPPRMERVK